MVLIVVFSVTSSILPVAKAGSEYNVIDPKDDVSMDKKLDRESSRTIVDQALEREAVRDKLQMIGYTVDEIKERISRLSDKEVQRMAERIEHVKAGGHLGLGNLNLVVLILLIILSPILAIVWVVLQLAGHEIHLDHAH